MRRLLGIAVVLLAGRAVWGQQAPSTAGAPYTLRANSRVVLTDVSVTDKKGNPIHGLKADDFRVLDNKQAQMLSSFEEHREDGAGVGAFDAGRTEPGTFSNAYLLHLPPVVNVMVLDVTHMRLQDQMYLYYEMGRFIERFPADQPLAIFLRSSGCLVLQSFTTDKALLLAAVKKAIPRFQPLGADYITDLETLHDIAMYLGPIPGRKNVLWFTAGSVSSIHPNGGEFVDMRPVYDELEAARIAVYPLDPRGLAVYPALTETIDHFQMNDVAEATGGRATYNNNGLDVAALRIIDTDRSFYTLTYAPRNFQYDNKWHTVKVEVKGGEAQLSYRRGYFADAFNAPQPVAADLGARTRLLRDGSKLQVPGANGPIVFEAKVSDEDAAAVDEQPKTNVAAKKGKQRRLLVYSVPVGELMLKQTDGEAEAQVQLSVEVMNRDGAKQFQRVDRVSMTVHTDKLAQKPDAVVQLRQLVDTGKGDEFLYLTVRDSFSGRLGYVQVPLK